MKIIICAALFTAITIAVYYQKAIIKKIIDAAAKYKNNINNFVKTRLVKVGKNEISRIEIIIVAATAALFLITMKAVALILGAVAAIAAPKLYVNLKQKKYIDEYYSQLPDFIESILSSLKAGLSMVRALQIKAEKNDGAISTEINMVIKKIELGQSLSQALNGLKERVPIKENEIFIAAVNTSIETGGNITHVLSNILDTIRRREELKRELKTMTSQGVLSGIIVGLLPVFLLVIIFFIDSQFVTPLFTTTAGNILLVAVVVMESIGAFIIKKIVTIE